MAYSVLATERFFEDFQHGLKMLQGLQPAGYITQMCVTSSLETEQGVTYLDFTYLQYIRNVNRKPQISDHLLQRL